MQRVTEPQRAETWIPRSRALTAALAAASIVAGLIVLVRPHSLVTIAVVSGIFLLADGVYELLDPDAESRGMGAMRGVLCIVAGILLVRHPGTSVLLTALVIGTWLLATGAMSLAFSVAYERRLRGVAVGAIQVVAGIVIVAIPGIGVVTLAVVTAVALIGNGLALLAVRWLSERDPGSSPAPAARGVQ